MDFGKKHSSAKSALEHWYRIIKWTAYVSFAELRRTFPSADQVGKFTVFNIGGNKCRLITVIHYNRGIVYVRDVLTHPEYDLGQWKKE